MFLLCFSLETFAKKIYRPKSPSIENLSRCFPELMSPNWGSHLDLISVKDEIDNKFPTQHSYVQFRQIEYHPALVGRRQSGSGSAGGMAINDGLVPTYRLIIASDEKNDRSREIGHSNRIRSKGVSAGAPNLSSVTTHSTLSENSALNLRVEVSTRSGEFLEDLSRRRKNPQPTDLAQVLRGMIVDRDRSSYLDLKLTGKSLNYTLLDGVPVFLELMDDQKMLRCEFAKELGVICTCHKKDEK